MLCERCKIREANIQYTEVINGAKTEHNLCAQCARELDFGPYSAIFDGDMPLGRLLSGLLGLGEASQKKENMRQVVCPTCQLSYDEFIKNSCFGCSDCYGVFDLLISDNIKQLQGSDTHCGKKPRYGLKDLESPPHLRSTERDGSDSAEKPDSGITAETAQTAGEQIKILEAKLRDALKREEYENAAIFRDKVKALKEGGDHA